jgi:Sec-independent protein secretion pathway component TatC
MSDAAPSVMPMVDHLEELRRRLLWSVGAVGLATAAALLVVFSPRTLTASRRARSTRAIIIKVSCSKMIGMINGRNRKNCSNGVDICSTSTTDPFFVK